MENLGLILKVYLPNTLRLVFSPSSFYGRVSYIECRKLRGRRRVRATFDWEREGRLEDVAVAGGLIPEGGGGTSGVRRGE